MKRNSTRKFYAALAAVVILSALLSACGTVIGEDSGITPMTVTGALWKRVDTCSANSLQMLKNDANGDYATYQGTPDDWLDAKKLEKPVDYACIEPRAK